MMLLAEIVSNLYFTIIPSRLLKNLQFRSFILYLLSNMQIWIIETAGFT